MTDTPADVAEALALADAARKEPVSYRGVAYAEVPTVAYDTIRAHIADLERQLAEAREDIERRPEDVVIPLALYDEINATGAQWKQRAESAESQLAEARGELAAKDEAYRLQFEACAQLAAQRERDGRDAEKWRWLRDATPCSLTLSRNDEHATNYMTAADWIEQFPEDFADEEPAEVERMKATNTIWTLQIYPNTPIGFNRWHGATLDAVIDAALKDRP
jgi:hypothetical protein